MPVNAFSNSDRFDVFGPSRFDVSTTLPSGGMNTDGSGNLSVSGSLTAVSGVVMQQLSGGVSSSVGTIAADGTITTSGVRVARVTNGGAITGVIMGTGTLNGQQCTVINTAANNITMAASGTSNVANGASSIVSALNSKIYTWSSAATLWFGQL